MSEPPDFSKMELDFSQFHPLNHHVLACRDYPGGRKRHLSYRWEFRWRERVRRVLLCPLRRHEWIKWTRTNDQRVTVRCRNCFRKKES